MCFAGVLRGGGTNDTAGTNDTGGTNDAGGRRAPEHTRTHVVSHGLIGSHLVSHGLTWSHLVSLGLTCNPLKPQQITAKTKASGT